MMWNGKQERRTFRIRQSFFVVDMRAFTTQEKSSTSRRYMHIKVLESEVKNLRAELMQPHSDISTTVTSGVLIRISADFSFP
jgi:hypothetical protein